MTSFLDKARAFGMIAEHLPPKKRKKTAKHIANLIVGKVGRPRPTAPQAAGGAQPPREVVDLSEHTETASFLVDHGYTGAKLAIATGQLSTYLAKHSNLTKEAAMRVWLSEQKPKEGAA